MTDKSIPSPASTPASSNASVETVMALHKSVRIAITAQCLHPCQVHLDSLERAEAALRAEVSRLATGRQTPLAQEDVEWVVNDIAELGVRIGQQFFWLYKGDSLVYGKQPDEQAQGVVLNHDTDPPKVIHWRPVFKREFGECCHPVNYADLRVCGHPHRIGTVSLDDSDEWKPIPAALPAAPGATSQGVAVARPDTGETNVR